MKKKKGKSIIEIGVLSIILIVPLSIFIIAMYSEFRYKPDVVVSLTSRMNIIKDVTRTVNIYYPILLKGENLSLVSPFRKCNERIRKIGIRFDGEGKGTMVLGKVNKDSYEENVFVEIVLDSSTVINSGKDYVEDLDSFYLYVDQALAIRIVDIDEGIKKVFMQFNGD